MARAVASNFERRASYEPDPHPNDEPTYDIGPKTGVRKAQRPVHAVEGCSARNRTSTTHAWNVPYRALYDRTYRVLYDAGINEKLADELATERTLATALSSRGKRSQDASAAAPARTTHLANPHPDRS